MRNVFWCGASLMMTAAVAVYMAASYAAKTEDAHLVANGLELGRAVHSGVIAAMRDLKITLPMVVRLVGTNEEEGRRLLADAKLITADSLADAAQKAVQAAEMVG